MFSQSQNNFYKSSFKFIFVVIKFKQKSLHPLSHRAVVNLSLCLISFKFINLKTVIREIGMIFGAALLVFI